MIQLSYDSTSFCSSQTVPQSNHFFNKTHQLNLILFVFIKHVLQSFEVFSIKIFWEIKYRFPPKDRNHRIESKFKFWVYLNRFPQMFTVYQSSYYSVPQN